MYIHTHIYSVLRYNKNELNEFMVCLIMITYMSLKKLYEI